MPLPSFTDVPDTRAQQLKNLAVLSDIICEIGSEGLREAFRTASAASTLIDLECERGAHASFICCDDACAQAYLSWTR